MINLREGAIITQTRDSKQHSAMIFRQLSSGRHEKRRPILVGVWKSDSSIRMMVREGKCTENEHI